MLVYGVRNFYNGTSGTELKGKKLGILAYGNVGRNVARIAKGFGMEVYAYDAFCPASVIEADGVKAVASTADLFKACQIVSLHIPATAETKGSINFELMNSMPKGAIVVNTARKEVMDEAGLAKMLEERPDFKYLTDIMPAIHAELAEKYAGRYFSTPKKMGAQTAEANINAGIAAAKQIVDFLVNGNEKYRINQLDLITMAKIKPFKGVRPPKEFIEEVASRPYDVLNSQEARAEAEGNEKSLYHIIKPEIDFPEGTDEHDPAVYLKAAANFNNFQEKGWLVQDQKECYYVYAQTMNGKTQYGLVVGAYVPDYMNGTIKKHELTRRDKEEDRMKHVRVNNANIEPVFFAYPDNSELDAIVMKYTAREPEYNFVAKLDGFGHTFWIIDEDKDIARITELFGEMPALYIADGHHRSAAAALVGAEKAKQNPDHKGDEEYNYFMAVCFPANQLTIIDYNRVVKDLNGLTEEQFVERLTKNFVVEEKGSAIYKPGALHNFSLYLGGKWYSLTAKPGTYDDNDPIGVLDVTISSNLILDEILGIKDLRSDKRIDFVGGIRGLGELKRRVDSGEMKVALALYPVTMKQLMDIADTGNIMPPKTTWFEPKLRSGLVIHKLD